ncbi:MAG: hypothetical protein ACI4J5_07090 [Oscillospiraceae bacterium]
MKNIGDFYKRLSDTNNDHFELEGMIIDFYCAVIDDDEYTEKSEALLLFKELYDWYCGGTDEGTWQYYERAGKTEEELALAHLKKCGMDEAAKMYALGMHDYSVYDRNAENYPQEWMDEAERIDSFIMDNEDNILMMLRNILLENRGEIERVMGGKAVGNADDRNDRAMRELCENDPELAEQIRRIQEGSMAQLFAMMNSDCGTCANRTENTGLNEFACKAYPDGVPSEVFLSRTPDKRGTECANGFCYECEE